MVGMLKDTLQLARDMVAGGQLPNMQGSECPARGSNLGDLEARTDQPNSHPFWRCTADGCRARLLVTRNTWADVRLPLQQVAGLGWLFSHRFAPGPLSPRDCALILGCAVKGANRAFNALLDNVGEYVTREQKKIVLKGQCESDGVYPRSFRNRQGDLVHLRAWGAMRRGDPKSVVLYPLKEKPIQKATGGSPPPCTVAEVSALMRKHMPSGSDHRVDVYHSDGEQVYRNLPTHREFTKKQFRTQVRHTPTKGKDGRRTMEFTALKKFKLKNGKTLLVWGGAQAADGRWAHLRKALPRGLRLKKASDRALLWKWARVWQWKSWASKQPMWTELGRLLGSLQRSGAVANVGGAGSPPREKRAT